MRAATADSCTRLRSPSRRVTGRPLPGSAAPTPARAARAQVNEELKQYFRPEFLNRLDEIIVFRQLTKAEVKQIADIMLKEVFKRAEGKGIKIDVTERFKARPRGSRPACRAARRPLTAASRKCKLTLFTPYLQAYEAQIAMACG